MKDRNIKRLVAISIRLRRAAASYGYDNLVLTAHECANEAEKVAKSMKRKERRKS